MINILTLIEKFIHFLEILNVKEGYCIKFIKLCIFLNGGEGFASNNDLKLIWKVELPTIYIVLEHFVDIGLISITKKDRNSKLPVGLQRYIIISSQVLIFLQNFVKKELQ